MYRVRAVDLSPNGRFLVSASYDCSVCIWNLRDGSRRNEWYGSRHFSSVSYHPDGRYVAAGDEDAVLWVWDTRTGQLTVKCKIRGFIRFGGVYVRTMFTPDGKRVATGRHGTLQCWDFDLLKDTHSGAIADDDDDITCQLDPIFEFNGNTVRSSRFFLLILNINVDVKRIIPPLSPSVRTIDGEFRARDPCMIMYGFWMHELVSGFAH